METEELIEHILRIKQRELNSLRVVFMSEKGQGLQPYQMQEKWE